MQVRNWRNWIILILLIAIVWSQLAQKPIPDAVIKMHEDSIAVLSGKVDSLQRNDAAKTKALQAATAQERETTQIYRHKESTLTNELQRARRTIQAMIDTVPDLGAYIDISDNLHVLRVARIYTIEREREFKTSLYDDLIEIKDSKFVVRGQIIGHKDIIIDQQAKTIRRQRRLIKWLKIGLPVALIGGALAREVLN